MFSIRPKNHHVIVSWEGLDQDERGRQFVPGSMLVYGRHVHPPVARVIETAPDVRGIAVGDRVIATKDVAALWECWGIEVQAIPLQAFDLRLERWMPTHEIAAKLTDAGPVAPPGRVVGRPVCVEASDIIEHVSAAEAVERLEVVSAPESPDLVGSVVLLPRRSAKRMEWAEAGQPWVSVLDAEVLGVEMEQGPR